MPRFYCPPSLPSLGTFELPPATAHHASRVLRLRKGDPVHIFDGLGNERHGTIGEISGNRVVIYNIIKTDNDRESPLKILLVQALTSSEKMDWVIQKATELGVTEIQVVNTERSVARLADEKLDKRLEHWKQIAISACEQCGRNVLPIVRPPIDIKIWLQQLQGNEDTQVILLPQGSSSFHSISKPMGRVTLLIGPEGGFTKTECEFALSCGFIPIRMGVRVLRTETAAIAGLAALQVLWGDFQ